MINEQKLKSSKAFLQAVRKLINDAEDGLTAVRSEMAENMQYYNAELPKPAYGIKQVDPVCREAVINLLATASDAFTQDETFEIVPDDVSNSMTIKVINEAVQKALNKHNNKVEIFTKFFLDQFICKIGVIKVGKRTVSKTDTQYKQLDISDIEQQAVMLAIELDDKEDVVATVDADTGLAEITQTIKEQQVYITNIKPESFIVSSDAGCLYDSPIVGHVESITIAELIDMGFDMVDIQKVATGQSGYQSNELLDAVRQEQATKTVERSHTAIDDAQKEVELYEVYVKTSMETGEDKDRLAGAKLKRVMLVDNVILSVEEVDRSPYVLTSPYVNPHSVIGQGVVDLTKDIQRAKTGILRQTFQYMTMQANPRITYMDGVDIMALQNPRPGVAIEVPNPDAIRMLTLTGAPPDSASLLGLLDQTRERSTGITSVGQQMPAEILKSGGSAIGAQMILSRQQSIEKMIMKNILEGGIKPLLQLIYTTLRQSIDKVSVSIDGKRGEIYPIKDGWPMDTEIKIKTPLGASAKLDKARLYSELISDMTTSQVASPARITSILKEKYGSCLDIVNVQEYLPSQQELQQMDMNKQLMQQMQQMQQQLQQLMQQNQQLSQKASEQAQAKLQLDMEKSKVQSQVLADKSALEERAQQHKEELDEAKLYNDTEKLAISKELLELKQKMAAIEAMTQGEVNYTTV